MKKPAFIVFVSVLGCIAAGATSHANVVIGNFAAIDSDTEVQDAVWFEGTFGEGVLPADLSEPGTRLFWYPGKAAVRGGELTSDASWDAGGIGHHSFAFGRNARARGALSAAFGQGWAHAEQSFAAGSGHAGGAHSVAFGAESYATGEAATAFGWWTSATGKKSTAHGSHTFAQGYAQFVVGQNNIPQGTADSISPGDLLFIVGNGVLEDEVSPGEPSNAFTIAKSGDAMVARDLSVGGTITVPESGDLSMGEFTAGSP